LWPPEPFDNPNNPKSTVKMAKAPKTENQTTQKPSKPNFWSFTMILTDRKEQKNMWNWCSALMEGIEIQV